MNCPLRCRPQARRNRNHELPESRVIRELRWPLAVMGSLLVAFILTGIPLPDSVNPWRPAWVALTLFYWCIAMPERVGVWWGWFTGVMLDVTHGALLGQHALGLAFIAYVAVRYHQRIRVFPPVQQALLAGALIFLHLATMVTLYNALGSRAYPLWYLGGALTSALIWPWLFVVLRDLRRKAQA